MKNKLLIFIPHIGGGGVEKNFFMLSNFLSKKINSIVVITVNKESKKNLDKRIKIISPKSDQWKDSSIYIKYLVSIVLLVKTLLMNRKYLILSFQANWYSIIIAKLFNVYHVTYEHSHLNKDSRGMLERKQSWIKFFKIIFRGYLNYNLRNLKHNFYYYLNFSN